MVERKAIKKKEDKGGLYFTSPSPSIEFISSGCTLLDCVLGGGYPLGRIVNIVGDKSTGKTLLAIEAAANFSLKYKDGLIWYRESEAAFDQAYAEALGMPVDKISFSEAGDMETVEDMFEDIEDILKSQGNKPGLYILDSLDALSDRAEMDRDLDEGTYGANKAKQMGQLFRRLTQKLSRYRICLIIISQVRDNIGVAFGERHTRSGGKALDFYASQAIWLAHLRVKKRTVKGVERAYGIEIKARCKKNKIALPFRECTFPIEFGYGIDDYVACMDWLKEIKRLDMLDVTNDGYKKHIKKIISLTDAEFLHQLRAVTKIVREVWSDIEEGFMPTRRKY